MTVVRKLFVSTGVLVAVNLIVGSWSVCSIYQAKQRFNIAVDKTARKLQLGGEINTIKSDMFVIQRGLVLTAFIKDHDGVVAQRREFEQRVRDMRAKLEETRPLITIPEGRRWFEVVESQFDGWLHEYEQIARLCETGDPITAEQHSLTRVLPIYQALGEASARFTQVYQRALESDKAAADAEYSRSATIAGLLLCASLVCFVGACWVIYQINRSLRRAVAELSNEAEEVAAAAGQVASSSDSMAQSAAGQAAALEQTSASTEEINSMAQRNTSHAQAAADLVASSEQRFAESNVRLKEMVAAMNEIRSSGDKVANIIRVIDEIAFQTNILALNAAVEAARAGDAGLGFAVVADEVRNLAQRSAQAAKDTATLIEESIGKSHEGKAKVDQVAETLHAVSLDARKVRALVDQVNAASMEQTRGIEQIAKAVTDMQRTTQTTAAGAEESASAASTMSSNARQLKQTSDNLNALIFSR